MLVRIRLSFGPPGSNGAAGRRAALALSSLLTPLALLAWLCGFWKLGADMKIAGDFVIARGLFSHWQVWFALGIALQFGAFLLQRFARSDEDDDPAFS